MPKIQAMITAFGTGIGEEFDMAKLRYHKIVLMADADVDGQHITTLCCTLIFRFMRPLIERGLRRPAAAPPLYRIKWSNAAHDYVFSDTRTRRSFADRHRTSACPSDERHPALQGLSARWTAGTVGTTMNSERRTLRQVT